MTDMTFRLVGEIQKANAKKAIDQAPYGQVMTLGEEKRTAMQNRKMWPMLTDISRQAKLNNSFYKPEHWKIIIMSAFNQELPILGLNGEPVNLSSSTSGLGKKRFADLIEFIYSVGEDRGVIWSDRSMEVYLEYR